MKKNLFLGILLATGVFIQASNDDGSNDRHTGGRVEQVRARVEERTATADDSESIGRDAASLQRFLEQAGTEVTLASGPAGTAPTESDLEELRRLFSGPRVSSSQVRLGRECSQCHGSGRVQIPASVLDRAALDTATTAPATTITQCDNCGGRGMVPVQMVMCMSVVSRGATDAGQAAFDPVAEPTDEEIMKAVRAMFEQQRATVPVDPFFDGLGGTLPRDLSLLASMFGGIGSTQEVRSGGSYPGPDVLGQILQRLGLDSDELNRSGGENDSDEMPDLVEDDDDTN